MHAWFLQLHVHVHVCALFHEEIAVRAAYVKLPSLHVCTTLSNVFLSLMANGTCVCVVVLA